MKNDTIQKLTSSVFSHSPMSETNINLWFWVAIIELIIIAFLVYVIIRRGHKNKLSFSDISKQEFKTNSNEDIDMNNLLDSINKSRDLYKILSRKCHPDRFINTPQYSIAEEIFQEISRNKRNYKQLCALRDKANSQLYTNI